MAHRAKAENLWIGETTDHATEARLVIDASPSEIYRVTTDYAHWSTLLSDVESVSVEGAKVRFRSAALGGHEVAVQFDNVEDREIHFHSVDAPPGASASGTYVLEPIDGGRRTRLVATFHLDVGGVLGIFVSNRSLRAMRQAKLRADLGDVQARFSSHLR